MSTEVIPERIRDRYDVAETRSAAAFLSVAEPERWAEILDVLGRFTLCHSEFVAAGGSKTKIAKWIDEEFRRYGWREVKFETETTMRTTIYPWADGGERRSQQQEEMLATHGHKVDNAKGRVAVEVEWNNKDTFYDRDLSNFRALHELNRIDVGVIVTRGDDIKPLALSLGREPSVYGSTTTNMAQLRARLERSGAGGCPVLAFGITARCYDADC